MASIKEATENAVAFARATLGPDRTQGIRLEEIESTKVGMDDAWLITLSMLRPPDMTDNFSDVLTGKGKREYKTFTVRKLDGEITSMKIRELADA